MSAPVILGTMTFGRSAQVRAAEAQVQLEELVRFVDALARQGKSAQPIVDTARIYQGGETEELLGDILAGNPALKSRIVIHTKAHPMVCALDAKGVRAQLTASLKALRCDKVAVFYLHSPDLRVPLVDTLRECDQLHREGLFDELGMSNYAAWDVAYAHFLCQREGFAVRPRVYQGVYSALNRSLEPELLPCCRTFGMRVVVYNPLAAGLLTGRYSTKEDVASATSGRFSAEFDIMPATAPAGSPLKGVAHKMYRERYSSEHIFAAIAGIRASLEGGQVPMAEAALRWAMHHSRLAPRLGDAVVFGASSAAQCQANLDACLKGTLPPGVVKAFDAAVVVAGPGEPYLRGYDAKPGCADAYLAKF